MSSFRCRQSQLLDGDEPRWKDASGMKAGGRRVLDLFGWLAGNEVSYNSCLKTMGVKAVESLIRS